MTETQKVGLRIITKDNEILIEKKIGSHEENTWNFPNGHIEKFKLSKEYRTREAKEETTLNIELIGTTPMVFTRDLFHEKNKDYITFSKRVKYTEKKPRITELGKYLEWRWCEWNNLSKPSFLPIKNLIKQGFNHLQIK